MAAFRRQGVIKDNLPPQNKIKKTTVRNFKVKNKKRKTKTRCWHKDFKIKPLL
jgi:hypothetical protein